MKTRTITALFLILILLSLSSCATTTATPDEGNDSDVDVTQYVTVITSLETELQRQKQSFSIKELAYKTEIADLQQQISTLSTQIEQSGTQNLTFTYRLENGEAIITGYSGGASILRIPATLDDYPVVAIGERVFENKDIAAVVLPEGLREIGWFAFYGCAGLSNITIPASVTNIGYAVFDGCADLRIYCPAGSYAEKFAKSYGISYVAS